jgi:hypothetical protein
MTTREIFSSRNPASRKSSPLSLQTGRLQQELLRGSRHRNVSVQRR